MTVGSGNARLDSWKAIAAYLGRDMGTVRRWERARGLPVHRVPGGKGSSVFAFTTEIDRWLQSAPAEVPAVVPSTPDPAPVRWPGLVMAAAVIAAILLVWRWQQPLAGNAPISVVMTDQALTAVTESGRELWVYRYGEGYRHPLSAVAERSRVVGGPSPGIYFTTSHRQGPEAVDLAGGEFTALTMAGARRWTFRFDDTVNIGGEPFGPPWAVTAFAVENESATRRLAVASHHWTWSASLLAVLDDAGRRLGTFVNDGWMEQLRWIAPNRLVVGGYSESRNGGMVVLLDPSRLDGHTPEEPGSRHECRDCGPHLPLRMFVLPRSEVNLVTASRFNRAILEWTSDRVIARTVEMPSSGQGVADAIYEFTADLALVRAAYSQRYWEVHDQLARAGTLDHDRAQCPYRDGPTLIHAWSPSEGWRTITGPRG